MQPQHHIEAGLAMEAAESLRSGQRTFSRAQVAVLIALAFTSGYEHGLENGRDDVLQDLHSALRHALGGEHATTMRHAVANHITALDQKRARAEADRAPAVSRPRGPHLNDPDWPPVTAPGTKQATTSRPATTAPHQRKGETA